MTPPSRSVLARHRRAIHNALEQGTTRADIARKYGVDVTSLGEYIARQLPEHATAGEMRRLERARVRTQRRDAAVRQWRASEQAVEGV
jgi:transposase-like protein